MKMGVGFRRAWGLVIMYLQIQSKTARKANKLDDDNMSLGAPHDK